MVHVNIPRIFLWIAVGCLGLSSSVQADEDYREVVDEAVAKALASDLVPDQLTALNLADGRK